MAHRSLVLTLFISIGVQVYAQVQVETAIDLFEILIVIQEDSEGTSLAAMSLGEEEEAAAMEQNADAFVPSRIIPGNSHVAEEEIDTVKNLVKKYEIMLTDGKPLSTDDGVNTCLEKYFGSSTKTTQPAGSFDLQSVAGTTTQPPNELGAGVFLSREQQFAENLIFLERTESEWNSIDAAWGKPEIGVNQYTLTERFVISRSVSTTESISEAESESGASSSSETGSSSGSTEGFPKTQFSSRSTIVTGYKLNQYTAPPGMEIRGIFLYTNPEIYSSGEQVVYGDQVVTVWDTVLIEDNSGGYLVSSKTGDEIPWEGPWGGKRWPSTPASPSPTYVSGSAALMYYTAVFTPGGVGVGLEDAQYGAEDWYNSDTRDIACCDPGSLNDGEFCYDYVMRSNTTYGSGIGNVATCDLPYNAIRYGRDNPWSEANKNGQYALCNDCWTFRGKCLNSVPGTKFIGNGCIGASYRGFSSYMCSPMCPTMCEDENAAFGVHNANLPKTVLVLQFGPMI